ncbi:hypothetical protein AAG906_020038 [Vitis piasezkii]
MHKLGTRRHSGVNSDAGGHSSYAPASTPTADDHAFPDGEEQPEGNVVPTNRKRPEASSRRMAPNLLSPYISQPQSETIAIKIDLKQGAAGIWSDLDCGSNIICCLHFYDIRNQVVDAYCRLLQYQHEPKSKLFLSPYIAVMMTIPLNPCLSLFFVLNQASPTMRNLILSRI